MIRTDGRIVKYGEVWFDEDPPADADIDVLIYRFRRTPIPKARTTPVHTLWTDLTAPQEALLGQLHINCRRKIQAANKEGLQRQTIAPSPEALTEFADFYDVFARQKAVWLADRHWLSRAAAAGQLTLSRVSRDGEPLVWHANLVCGCTARVAYSASWFRGRETEYRTLIGRANRWLHWQDLLHFQTEGLQCYDWGGLFADDATPERAGINEFKRTFGGLPVQGYECTVPATMRGRVWLHLRETLRQKCG